WVAHASRVLASASSRSRTFPPCPRGIRPTSFEKTVSAGRRNQHARRVRYPDYSERPRFQALTNRLCVTVHIDFFQPFNSVSHYFSRLFIFFPGRFEERPEKRQGKNAPVQTSQGRLHFNFCLSLRAGGVADREANGDSDAQCTQDRRHRIFAHVMFGALTRAARFFLGVIRRLAHCRGDFVCCSTKLLTPS